MKACKALLHCPKALNRQTKTPAVAKGRMALDEAASSADNSEA